MGRMPPTKRPITVLRDFALSLPGAHEAFPWGERVAKVGKKVFVFLGRDEEDEACTPKQKKGALPGEYGMSVKLSASRDEALAASFAAPTGYGLGNKGWVSMTFRRGDKPPMEHMKTWIEESYRAIAPKKLVAELDARTAKKKR
jgi:predicted DNA-binding protein (MmcQ/YjbR family)